MKKRLISLLVAGMTLLAMAGCSESAPETRPTTETTVAATELSAEEQQILTQRREAVVQRMRDMTTFLWRSDVDITYSKQRSSTGPENDDQKNVITLKAGRLYSGLPYTHGGSSIYDWQKFATRVDENGIYQVSGITGSSSGCLGPSFKASATIFACVSPSYSSSVCTSGCSTPFSSGKYNVAVRVRTTSSCAACSTSQAENV